MIIVMMCRYGDPSEHCYVLGAWEDPKEAKTHGDFEVTFRGNKYEPRYLFLGPDGFVVARSSRPERAVVI